MPIQNHIGGYFSGGESFREGGTSSNGGKHVRGLYNNVIAVAFPGNNGKVDPEQCNKMLNSLKSKNWTLGIRLSLSEISGTNATM
ncbi:MAG: hypothetical protein ACI9S8_002998 [Chlamydiales bacterium]|jgi:hypothetical protein